MPPALQAGSNYSDTLRSIPSSMDEGGLQEPSLP